MHNLAAPSAYEIAAKYSPARRRLALFVVALAFLLDLLDSTIVNLAVPSIRTSLHANAATVQWLVAGYALSFSMLLILGGRLGDLYGYRRIFVAGVCGFALASLACGLARSDTVLVFARLAQGAAAALMAPQVMSMVQLLYRPTERGAVMGLFGLLGGVGASLGPVLGGFLIKADLFGLAWRPIFLVNLPVAAVALIAGALTLPPGRSPRPEQPDLGGAALVIVAVFLMVFPMIQGREAGWPAWSFAMLIAAVSAIGIYAIHVRRRCRFGRGVLTPVELFTDRAFVAGLSSNLALQAAFGGYFLIFSLTLQLGFGADVLRASMITLPFSIGVTIGIAGIGRRFGVSRGRRLIQFGLVILLLGWSGLIAIFQLHSCLQQALLIPALFAAGAGMGLVIAPLSGLTLSRIDVTHAGAASGVFTAVQQLGSALGAAAIGAIYFARQTAVSGAAGYRSGFTPGLLAAMGLVAVAGFFARRLPAAITARPA